jgi:hypothetical protein
MGKEETYSILSQRSRKVRSLHALRAVQKACQTQKKVSDWPSKHCLVRHRKTHVGHNPVFDPARRFKRRLVRSSGRQNGLKTLISVLYECTSARDTYHFPSWLHKFTLCPLPEIIRCAGRFGDKLSRSSDRAHVCAGGRLCNITGSGSGSRGRGIPSSHPTREPSGCARIRVGRGWGRYYTAWSLRRPVPHGRRSSPRRSKGVHVKALRRGRRGRNGDLRNTIKRAVRGCCLFWPGRRWWVFERGDVVSRSGRLSQFRGDTVCDGGCLGRLDSKFNVRAHAPNAVLQIDQICAVAAVKYELRRESVWLSRSVDRTYLKTTPGGNLEHQLVTQVLFRDHVLDAARACGDEIWALVIEVGAVSRNCNPEMAVE